jgi:hypothetical protein
MHRSLTAPGKLQTPNIKHRGNFNFRISTAESEPDGLTQMGPDCLNRQQTPIDANKIKETDESYREIHDQVFSRR